MNECAFRCREFRSECKRRPRCVEARDHLPLPWTAMRYVKEHPARVYGYAVLFDKMDLSGDIIRPGSFTRSLMRRGPSSVRMLFQHSPRHEIGKWEEIKEDEHGLFAVGHLTLNSRNAGEVAALISTNAVDGLSIGFNAVRWEIDKDKNRHLYEIDLHEISIVTCPTQPDARVKVDYAEYYVDL